MLLNHWVNYKNIIKKKKKLVLDFNTYRYFAGLLFELAIDIQLVIWAEAAYIIVCGPVGQSSILWQPEASPIQLWPKATTILNIL